ncbi:cytochrome C [Sulfurifustis variabilis]|uniref:Cytochrome C n=1 Tax=Sulfurifustis variabilis TaxID=1675686 RepID=A0A1B4V2Q1_9GAMM|nr:c-type cytochrome [Sulfurifustis variabilis]BAU46732.1 cytochrome C [Sulfurifustis variabilis]
MALARISVLLFLSALGAAAFAERPPAQPKAPGIESPDYAWDAPVREEVEALRREGNAARGREAYEVCRGCHGADAAGRPDGSYPRLAGQHATVLIKQLADIRAGRRDNQKMYPFASRHVLDVQGIADLAAYLEGLPAPEANGRGEGTDLERGRRLYERDCASCHGKDGAGDAARFYPALAGQHYRFLLRELHDIRDGKRRNANPEMVQVVKPYTEPEMEAVSDHLSRLRR